MNRRALIRYGVQTASVAFLDPSVNARQSSQQPGSITDVAGIKVGHFTETRRPTGCTVILFEEGAVCGVDVRGGAPGTRETDLLAPQKSAPVVHAILLSGGSTFGLDAATGVMRYLEERAIGIETRAVRVPLVPAAILYDLAIGDHRIRPDATSGYRACEAARANPPMEGNVGAGAGATVGKVFGMNRAMKGGIGSASIRLPGEPVVGAIVAVNAVGDVLDPATGQIIAGVRTKDGRKVLGSLPAIYGGEPLPQMLGGTATTLGVVATDAKLSKAQAAKVAEMAHDGLARVINPLHTPADGDTVFSVATGKSVREGNVALIGLLAAEAASRAVLRAIRAARGLAGIPSSSDL
jgi:L-aminopeptidase/D-esterase-like protein